MNELHPAVTLLPDLSIILILVIGIWQFRSPRQARFGNLTAAFALISASILILYRNGIIDIGMVVMALAVGSLIGYGVARAVNMIQIPAMVAFQHGAGGIAAFLISLIELLRGIDTLDRVGAISGVLGLIIGSLTFSGSMIASAKLSNRIRQTPQVLPAHSVLVMINIVALVAVGILARYAPRDVLWMVYLIQIVLAACFGILFTIRIGGADMPVVISFLNATAGLAASFCGMVTGNQLLIAFGAIVAASGSILTLVMCRSMNRSLFRIFFPPFHKVVGACDVVNPAAIDAAGTPISGMPILMAHEARNVVCCNFDDKPGYSGVDNSLYDQYNTILLTGDAKKTVSSLSKALDEQEGGVPTASHETAPADRMADAVAALNSAADVIVVPGYGMALAKAQFKVVELASILRERGSRVQYAIHPVAGRMPGHMNVILAEAEVDYEDLLEMDEANPRFRETDVVLIIGACDVVNPAAIHQEGTPISGMPILTAHEAKQIIVCNLDDKPGYSGVENPLYENEKTTFLPGDAKETISRLIGSLELR